MFRGPGVGARHHLQRDPQRGGVVTPGGHRRRIARDAGIGRARLERLGQMRPAVNSYHSTVSPCAASAGSRQPCAFPMIIWPWFWEPVRIVRASTRAAPRTRRRRRYRHDS